MGSYKFVVFTDPVEGRDEEFNRWYSDEHLADVVAVPGVTSAARFRLAAPGAGAMPNQYLAIYEFDTDDPKSVFDEIFKRWGTSAMPMSSTLNDKTFNAAIFEPCSSVVNAKPVVVDTEAYPK